MHYYHSKWGYLEGSNVGKGKNAINIFATKNTGINFHVHGLKNIKVMSFPHIFREKLHFLRGTIGLTRSKTADMMKGPYFFLLC